MQTIFSVAASPFRYMASSHMEDLPRVAQLHAKMSDDAYLEPAERVNIPFDGQLWEVDTDFNEDAWVVYRHRDQMIVAYRGSATTHDWLVKDMGILWSDAPAAVINLAFSFTQTAIKARQPKTVHLTGHSLGGTIVYNVWYYAYEQINKWSPSCRIGECNLFNPGCGWGRAYSLILPAIGLLTEMAANIVFKLAFEAERPVKPVGNPHHDPIKIHHVMGDPISMTWNNPKVLGYGTRYDYDSSESCSVKGKHSIKRFTECFWD